MELVEWLKASEIVVGLVVTLIGGLFALLVWWEKDDVALMLESPLDDSVTPEDDVLRARCYLAGPPRNP